MNLIKSSSEVFLFERFLSERLNEYNEKYMNTRSENICIYIDAIDKSIIAGLTGEIYGDGLYIKYLWVDVNHRGGGFGKLLLEHAESNAVDAGCKFIILDTFSFQAPKYYERQGFETFGTISCGNYFQRSYLRKEI